MTRFSDGQNSGETGAEAPGDERYGREVLEERVRELEGELQMQQEELQAQNEELRIQVEELNQKSISLEQEIQERNRIESRLRRQAELIDLSPDAIIIRQLDGDITFWSRGAETLYGWTKAEAIGQSTHSLLKTQFPVPLEDINRKLIETGRWSGELTHATKDGRKVVVMSWWLGKKGGRIYEILESNVDITGLKQLENELQDARIRAELYIDIMGHDINNLNQVTIGNLELIAEDESLDADQRSMIAEALNAAKGSASIIDNVRKIQAINEGREAIVPEDIDEMITHCIELAPRPEGRNIVINYKSRPHRFIQGSALMKEVFSNLIYNAIKHTEGDITIDVGVDEKTKRGKSFYEISIADNGSGIPDEVKPKLFSRFQRGTTKAHGKGLGLFIVKSLVEQAGGDVTVGDRVPGDYSKGSKFTIMLPVYEGV